MYRKKTRSILKRMFNSVSVTHVRSSRAKQCCSTHHDKLDNDKLDPINLILKEDVMVLKKHLYNSVYISLKNIRF